MCNQSKAGWEKAEQLHNQARKTYKPSTTHLTCPCSFSDTSLKGTLSSSRYLVTFGFYWSTCVWFPWCGIQLRCHSSCLVEQQYQWRHRWHILRYFQSTRFGELSGIRLLTCPQKWRQVTKSDAFKDLAELKRGSRQHTYFCRCVIWTFSDFAWFHNLFATCRTLQSSPASMCWIGIYVR